MSLLAGVAALAIAAAPEVSDVEALAQLWPGIRDSTEQTFIGTDVSSAAWGEGAQRRVRTLVAPVSAPWLGAHVLYWEDFLHDDPDNVRRQLLLVLEPQAGPATGVRVRLYSFDDPRSWAHLDRRPRLLARLSDARLTQVPGCDFVLHREGDEFTGGTIGHRCADGHVGSTRYVDFEVLVGKELYWYRRRILSKPGDDLQEEMIGFNWFELNDTRLFTCRIDWSPSGRKVDLKPLVRLDLQDQGGRGQFTTPDGRTFGLTLHSDDWPFMSDRDALILQLQEESHDQPLAVSWTEVDSDDIAITLPWLRIRCGSLVPDTDELWSQARPAPEPLMPGSVDQRINVAQQHWVEPLGRVHHQEMAGMR